MKIQRTGTGQPRYLKALICGDPGSAKTLFCSTAPNVLIISMEGGRMSIEDRHVPFVEVDNSTDFLGLLRMLQAGETQRARYLKSLGFDGSVIDTVAVDTIDELSQILAKERYTAGKRDSLDLQGYGWLKEQMKGITTALRNLELHVVMTSHLRSRDDDEGHKSIWPAIEGGFNEKIAGYVDVAGLLRSNMTTEVINGQTQKVLRRWLQVYPDAMHSWLKDRSGKLPYEVDIDCQDDFMRICRLIWPDKGPTLSTVTQEEVEAYRQKLLADQDAPGEEPPTQSQPETPVAEPEPAVPVGNILQLDAKKAVFAAAGLDGPKATAAWKAAGLDGRSYVTQPELDEAVRLAALAIPA